MCTAQLLRSAPASTSSHSAVNANIGSAFVQRNGLAAGGSTAPASSARPTQDAKAAPRAHNPASVMGSGIVQSWDSRPAVQEAPNQFARLALDEAWGSDSDSE